MTSALQAENAGSSPAIPTKNIVRRQPCYCDNEVEHLRLILQLFFNDISYRKIIEITKTYSSFGEGSHSRNNCGGTKVSLVDMGRDTPTDYRRISRVLNFLKPCPNLNWELCFGSPAAETAGSNPVQDRFESYAKHQYGSVVQRLERLSVTQDVVGSNPIGTANKHSLCKFLQCVARKGLNVSKLGPHKI